MKRLKRGLWFAAGLSLLVAIGAGLLPRGKCGSYFNQTSDYTRGLLNPDGEFDLCVLVDGRYGISSSDGYPAVFWAFFLLAIALGVAAVVIGQVIAHQHEKAVTATTLTQRPTGPNLDSQRSSTSPSANHSELAEQLQALGKLHEAGSLTDEEFSTAKARLLGL